IGNLVNAEWKIGKGGEPGNSHVRIDRIRCNCYGCEFGDTRGESMRPITQSSILVIAILIGRSPTALTQTIDDSASTASGTDSSANRVKSGQNPLDWVFRDLLVDYADRLREDGSRAETSDEQIIWLPRLPV